MLKPYFSSSILGLRVLELMAKLASIGTPKAFLLCSKSGMLDDLVLGLQKDQSSINDDLVSFLNRMEILATLLVFPSAGVDSDIFRSAQDSAFQFIESSGLFTSFQSILADSDGSSDFVLKTSCILDIYGRFASKNVCLICFRNHIFVLVFKFQTHQFVNGYNWKRNPDYASSRSRVEAICVFICRSSWHLMSGSAYDSRGANPGRLHR